MSHLPDVTPAPLAGTTDDDRGRIPHILSCVVFVPSMNEIDPYMYVRHMVADARCKHTQTQKSTLNP